MLYKNDLFLSAPSPLESVPARACSLPLLPFSPLGWSPGLVRRPLLLDVSSACPEGTWFCALFEASVCSRRPASAQNERLAPWCNQTGFDAHHSVIISDLRVWGLGCRCCCRRFHLVLRSSVPLVPPLLSTLLSRFSNVDPLGTP